jgi:hypothetical protein
VNAMKLLIVIVGMNALFSLIILIPSEKKCFFICILLLINYSIFGRFDFLGHTMCHFAGRQFQVFFFFFILFKKYIYI